MLEHEGPCRSQRKQGVLNTGDCPFKTKDIKPVFPHRKLGIGCDL